ncbi:MAG: hypothetical protein JWL77_1011 [Chthonomonadaceae bacterium]|nr:hypothetical protein [Chthonomonadaceae bacterium]
MARKESLDRSLLDRLRTAFQSIEADSLLLSSSEDLLAFIRKTPLVYGFWSDFKRLFKAAEKATPVEPTAALLARLDTADVPRASSRLPSAPMDGQLVGIGRMDFDGRHAYLVSTHWNAPGLYIVDMTHPAMPQIVSTIKLQGLTDAVVVATKLFLLQGAWNVPGRLACYDISDPAYPKPESGVEIGSGVQMQMSGGLIAVLTQQHLRSGLQLIDASQPGRLRTLGYLALACPIALQIVGSTAYIVNTGRQSGGSNSLIIADISDPMHPRQVKEIVLPLAQSVAVQGRYAYVACCQGKYTVPDAQTGLAVLDIAPPDFAGARQIAMLSLGNVQDLVIRGNYAYVSVGQADYSDRNNGGLRVVEISDPVRPRVVGSWPADHAGPIKVAGDVVYLTVTSQWADYFRALNVAEPSRPLLFGASPSRETLGYMKRRGRRLLHALALRDPETYVRVAAQMLLDAGQVRSELDPRTQWISMDLLYGGGTRYEQQAHGRGSYGTPRPGLSIRSREERHPELWNRYPELAEPLYTTPKLPWQTWETACKILRTTHTPLPALSDKMLAGFLASPSPLLRSIAGRQVVATLEAGRKVAADIAADTYFGGTRRQRETIDRFVSAQDTEARWNTAFATRLYQRAAFAVKGPLPPRKATLAFALLIARFPALFSRDIRPQTTVALYGTGRPDFMDWALEVFRTLLPMQLEEWLEAIGTLPTEIREAAMQSVLAGFETKPMPAQKLGELVRHTDPWVRQTVWRIAAHSPTTPVDIASVWLGLLDSNESTPALATAFESPDALALFARCAFDSRLMADRLEAHPFLIPLLPTAALEKVVTVLPSASVLRLVAGASEEQWPGLRAAILLGALLPETRAAFWREAFASIGATGSTILSQRLLEDATLRAAFLQLAEITEFLRSANPVFGPLLGQWIGAHTDLLLRDSAELLQIATHPLPDIRTVGLERVRQVGMSLPFALRLLESELPPSIALGKTFFEAIQTEDSGRTEAITALCDSPKPSVRAYGREFLTAHAEMLADMDVLERLSENPDPETQAFVAGRLLHHPTPPETTGAFDRSVLRARDRGRRAKELVKTRLDKQPSVDVALLLEMARSRTPRDADWALGQLAKLALEGVEIPGLTLDGVAGG